MASHCGFDGVSLMMSDAECLFIHLLAFCVSSLEHELTGSWEHIQSVRWIELASWGGPREPSSGVMQDSSVGKAPRGESVFHKLHLERHPLSAHSLQVTSLGIGWSSHADVKATTGQGSNRRP